MAMRKPAHWRREKSAFGKPGLVSPDGLVFACLSRHEDSIMVNYDQADGAINASLYLPIANLDLPERYQSGPVYCHPDGGVYGAGITIPIPLRVLRWLALHSLISVH